MPSYTQEVQACRDAYNAGKMLIVEERRKHLMSLWRLMEEQSEEILAALKKDLSKPKFEGVLMEIAFVKNELVCQLDHLDEWTAPQKVGKNLMTMMDGVFIKPEPLGVVLIMSAWNYPIQLTLGPLCGALAAGNTVIIKPSELSANIATLLEKIIPKYFPSNIVTVINGAIPETNALLKERFDYILYTGGSAVAKIIYESAAKHLTPVTLELGGKSPVYLDPSSNLEIAARRIVWGRFSNSGQTCIAPDYVMCPKGIESEFVRRCKDALLEFFGENAQESESYGRIVNNRHFNRIKAMLNGANIAVGGKTDEKDKFIEPTILVDVKPTDSCMQDEIFGPILPVMCVSDVDEAIAFINSREKPLALYVFSKNGKTVDKIMSRTTSGGITVNDTVMHASVETLPFGGVGNSGIGAYHGKFSFDTFSHKRSCLVKKQAMEGMNQIRYPPYTDKKLNLVTMITGKKPGSRNNWKMWVSVLVLGVLLGLFLKTPSVMQKLKAVLTAVAGL
ncbi:hypothetical protein CAPTEDRAFT_149199 [Capitella teleta]|uniref:Aldehyde dehydrogenase n=1 Tax=Capitella teleta TaxID=283909 RepID=R7VKE7_CAPTE|nr:hypothetical protein CAPTEDRAFT_149199 [Capitella teleta]|eukprot:ELU17311.1 hypothetical protein CAPTEDRAFT_149199 [Capitella teleta]